MLKIKDDIDLKVLEKYGFGNYINQPINSYLYQVYDEDDFRKAPKAQSARCRHEISLNGNDEFL